VEKYCTVGQATDDSITRRMRCACWITKATDTHLEFVLLIDFSLQLWLRERATMLRHTYIACLAVIDVPEGLSTEFSLQPHCCCCLNRHHWCRELA
jgi:hypothetical protein